MSRADVLIIGGGLMGLATAMELGRAGKKVILLEKDTVGRHASGVNAGGVRRLNRHVAEIPMTLESQEMWANMEKYIGCNCTFTTTGQILAANCDEEIELLKKRAKTTSDLGYNHEELIDEKELRKLVPAIADDFIGGLISRKDGHALPYKACRAYQQSALKAGVIIEEHTKVLNVSQNGSGFTVTTANGKLYEGELLLNCAGAWGAKVAALLGENIPMEPVALSMMVTARMPKFITPVVSGFFRSLSFKQMTNGTVVVGGARRAFITDDEQTRINTEQMHGSAQTVVDFFPIMKDASIVRWWAGFEGMISDKLPIIGEAANTPGFFHTCGFSTHGFQLAPIVGKLMAETLQGKRPHLSLEAFRADRETLFPKDNDAPKKKGAWQ